jgi:hypothetical protein
VGLLLVGSSAVKGWSGAACAVQLLGRGSVLVTAVVCMGLHLCSAHGAFINLERGCRDPLARGNLPDTWGVAVLPPGAWQAWCHIVSAFPRVLLLFQSFLVDILMD